MPSSKPKTPRTVIRGRVEERKQKAEAEMNPKPPKKKSSFFACCSGSSRKKEIILLLGPPAAGKVGLLLCSLSLLFHRHLSPSSITYATVYCTLPSPPLSIHYLPNQGTVGPRISAALNIPILSTGDMLRQAVSAGTAVGLQATELMSAGKLVPDEVVTKLIQDRTAKKKDCKDGYILDGFPRTVAQAKALDALLRKSGQRVTKVLVLEVEEKVLKERISGRWVHKESGRSYHAKARPPKSLPKGKRPSLSNMKDDETGEPLMQRPDDTAATLKDRLKAYHEETEPIIAYYTDAGVVARVDGNEAEKCWKQSAQALNVSP
jgi:adenylate kinase